MPGDPLAYFITIRAYGTWLSGDSRGSVDDEHRTPGEPFKQRDDFRVAYQKRKMSGASVHITPPMRGVIEGEIQRTCSFRDWQLWALNVRTNHVHTVVSADQPVEAVMRELKVYTTRALRREGLVAASQSMWASHGSTRYAWNDDDVEAYIVYTMDHQGDDLPGAGWRAASRLRQDPTRP